MRREENILRSSVYKKHNKTPELMYHWMLKLGDKDAEIYELHLDTQDKICTFDLPKLYWIKKNIDEQDYLDGIVKVKYDCFKEAQNVKNLRVVLPQKYSYRFERGEFTNNFCPHKNVTISLPKGMNLFEVREDSKIWILAADERLGNYCELLGKTIEPLDRKNIKKNFGYHISVEENFENV